MGIWSWLILVLLRSRGALCLIKNLKTISKNKRKRLQLKKLYLKILPKMTKIKRKIWAREKEDQPLWGLASISLPSSCNLISVNHHQIYGLLDALFTNYTILSHPSKQQRSTNYLRKLKTLKFHSLKMMRLHKVPLIWSSVCWWKSPKAD